MTPWSSSSPSSSFSRSWSLYQSVGTNLQVKRHNMLICSSVVCFTLLVHSASPQEQFHATTGDNTVKQSKVTPALSPSGISWGRYRVFSFRLCTREREARGNSPASGHCAVPQWLGLPCLPQSLFYYHYYYYFKIQLFTYLLFKQAISVLHEVWAYESKQVSKFPRVRKSAFGALWSVFIEVCASAASQTNTVHLPVKQS